MNIAQHLRDGHAVVLCPRCQFSEWHRYPDYPPWPLARLIVRQRCPRCGGLGLDVVEPGDGSSLATAK